MAEEEETAACTCTLTSFENHVAIGLWAETVKEHVRSDAILLLDALEVEWCVDFDIDDTVNHLDVFALLDFSLLFEDLLAISQPLRETCASPIVLDEVRCLGNVP